MVPVGTVSMVGAGAVGVMAEVGPRDGGSGLVGESEREFRGGRHY